MFISISDTKYKCTKSLLLKSVMLMIVCLLFYSSPAQSETSLFSGKLLTAHDLQDEQAVVMRIIHRLDSKTIPLPYSLDLSIGSEGQFDGKLKGGDVSIYLDIKLQSAKIKSYNNSAALRATFNILLSSDNSSDSPQKSNLQLIFNSEGTGETSDDEDQGGGTIGLDFDLINNAVTGDSHEIVRFNSTNKNGMLHTRSVELRFQPGPESTSLTGAPAHLFNTPLPGEDLIATIPLSIDSDSDIASYTLSIAETNADGSVESVQIPIRVKRKR